MADNIDAKMERDWLDSMSQFDFDKLDRVSLRNLIANTKTLPSSDAVNTLLETLNAALRRNEDEKRDEREDEDRRMLWDSINAAHLKRAIQFVKLMKPSNVRDTCLDALNKALKDLPPN